MTDLDVQPMLEALARDVSRQVHVQDPELVRRHGDQRRLGKTVGMSAALLVLTGGTFGLMAQGGFGGEHSASPMPEVVSGSATQLPTSESARRALSVPDSITSTPPQRKQAPDRSVSPRPQLPWSELPVQTSTPSPLPPGSTTSPTRKHPPTSSLPPASTAGPSTPMPTPSTPPPSATPTNPAAPVTPPAATAAPAIGPYAMWLPDVVDGRAGTKEGRAEGFSAANGGSLPYSPRVATTALTGTGGAGAGGSAARTTTALGVDTAGRAHLTHFEGGKVAKDHLLPSVSWGNATALVAHRHPEQQTVSVLAFHADGHVVRHVISWPGSSDTPSVESRTSSRTGPTGVTAATHARPDVDGTGAHRSVWAYVVAGDRLLLVKSAPDGSLSTVDLAGGLRGTVTLARLSGSSKGIGGVAAWSRDGIGSLYYGVDPFGPLSFGGGTARLPR